MGFPGGSDGKESACNAGDLGWEDPLEKGMGYRLQYSGLENSPGLISFRMDWLDLLAVQGTLKSLLQHHSSKASILLCSAFFIVQLSLPYMTTGKGIVVQ